MGFDSEDDHLAESSPLRSSGVCITRWITSMPLCGSDCSDDVILLHRCGPHNLLTSGFLFSGFSLLSGRIGSRLEALIGLTISNSISACTKCSGLGPWRFLIPSPGPVQRVIDMGSGPMSVLDDPSIHVMAELLLLIHWQTSTTNYLNVWIHGPPSVSFGVAAFLDRVRATVWLPSPAKTPCTLCLIRWKPLSRCCARAPQAAWS